MVDVSGFVHGQKLEREHFCLFQHARTFRSLQGQDLSRGGHSPPERDDMLQWIRGRAPNQEMPSSKLQMFASALDSLGGTTGERHSLSLPPSLCALLNAAAWWSKAVKEQQPVRCRWWLRNLSKTREGVHTERPLKWKESF